MFLRQQKRANGKTNLSIIKGYRDPVTKKSKQKVVKNLGYLEDYLEQYEDPIAYFKELAEQMTKDEARADEPISFDFSLSDKVSEGSNRKNYGFSVLSSFYHQLSLNDFWNNRQKSSNFNFNLNQIFQALIYLRVLSPASKMATFNELDNYFFDYDFSLHDVYRALSIFNSYKNDFIGFINQSIISLYGRDTSKVYYDVTNYFFEIDCEDDFRKKGVSKEHRPNPLVSMGLLMDSNSIPISYKLFAGNTNDAKTLTPVLDELKEQFNLKRIVVVADKGMNSGNNMVYNILNGDGYIYSQSVRGASEELKSFILSDEGYHCLSDDFKIKSRVIPTKIWVKLRNGRKKRVQVDQKQVVYFSSKFAQRQKNLRAATISKAESLINRGVTKPHNSAYDYLQTSFVDLFTGEILNDYAINSLNIDKIEEQETFDGYYLIVTSELDMSDNEIIDAYHGLSKIEESFKITKSNLKARPVYLSRKDRIESHFLICFVALTLLRLLELNLKDSDISLNQAISELKLMSASHISENYYLFDRNNDVIRKFGELLKIDFTKKIRTLGDIKSIVAKVK